MRTTKIVCAIAAASFGLSGFAFAQGNEPYTERAMPSHNGQGQQSSRAPARPAQSRSQGRSHDQRQARYENQARYDHDGRGAGPEHNFYRGGRLPAQYRDRQYVVDDWRDHHLNAPPRGYHWVQAGDDYVLAAIATGVIASILLNSH